MKSWDAAVNQVRRRAAIEVVRSIRLEPPFEFDPTANPSDISDFLETEWERILSSHDTVLELPGRDLNFARDVLIAATKFFHVLDCARQARERGALTWTLVDAYHAALLGSRAIAALYGVLSYSVKGRTLLVDFRPEFGRVDEVKKFKREHRGISDPIRILRPDKGLFEQRDAWSLLGRLCNVTPDFEGELKRIAGLSEISEQPLSALRNQILYDSVYWKWREDFELTRADESTLAKRFNVNDETVKQLLGAVSRIREVALIYTMELCAQVGFDAARLPESLRIPLGEPCFG